MMRGRARLVAGLLLAVLVMVGSLAVTADPAAARSSPGSGAGLTYDEWRTGRLVLGVVGLAFMGLVAVRAVRGWRARRRGTGL